MVPKHSLLKYFTLTFTRPKSSKFEGSGPPLNRFFHLGKNRNRFLAIFGDFFLGNQIRHQGNTEEDCKDLLPSMVSLLGTVEISKETEWKVIE